MIVFASKKFHTSPFLVGQTQITIMKSGVLLTFNCIAELLSNEMSTFSSSTGSVASKLENKVI